MRARLAALPLPVALLLTAAIAASCSPAPPGSEPSATPPAAQSPANPGFAAIASAELVTGQWFFRDEEGALSAGFGLPQSEFQFIVTCEQATGKVTVMSDHELVPDQDTQIRLITERATLDLPARSYNEGMPYILAELEGRTALSRAVTANLGDAQARFGVAVGGGASAFPWGAELTHALENCR